MTIRSYALPTFLAFLALVLVAVAVLALRDSPPAAALEFTVTRFDDPVPNGCLPNDCSLREAVIATNDPQIGPDLINLPAGTYMLTRDGIGPSAGVGDLDVDDDLAVIGEGASTTIIDASQLDDRIFDFGPFVSPAVVAGLTLRNGSVISEDGGLIRSQGQLQVEDVVIEGGGAEAGHGGAIASLGIASDNYFLTLIRTTVQDSEAAQDGGAIYTQSRLTIVDSTVTGNEAGGDGGGIQLYGDGELAMTNSTVSGNTASGTGGGINNVGSSSATLASVTVTGNTAGQGGGLGGDFTLRNTIVSANTDTAGDPDCYGNLVSEPANHIGIQSANCVVTGETTFNSTGDAMLGPLTWNGGPTDTHALLPGSPAIDTGADTGCTSATGGALAKDQRGGMRHVGARCDKGAYEFGAVPPATPTPTPEPPPPTPTPTRRPTVTPGLTPSPTPTLAPGECPEPTATPTPSPTPTFFFPESFLYACNDTGVTATGLQVSVDNAANFAPMRENAPGCPDPTYTYNPVVPAPLYQFVTIDWGTPCVDPGEVVVLQFGSDCPGCKATVNSYSWLFDIPTPSQPPAIQGDVTCDKNVDSVDALGVLRDAAGFDEPPCIEQGDVDCDGDHDSVDALGILRYVAALPPLEQDEPCADIGTPI